MKFCIILLYFICVCNYSDTYDHFLQLFVTIITFNFLIVTKGTAKTTICTSIASYLGWNFLTIDTASFLADGLQNVASRMSYIFDRLKVLERSGVCHYVDVL
jgi:ATPase family associated with various cellular activities (AAA)